MTTPKFCSQCGSPLAANSRFCGNCGAAVQAPPATPSSPTPQAPPAQAYTPPPAAYNPPPPPPAPQQPSAPYSQPAPNRAPVSGEAILAVVPGLTRSKGFMGVVQESYTLVVTDQRLIFAAYTNRVATTAVKAARAEAKSQGKGFFGQWGSQMSAMGMGYYLQMTPEEILAEENGSFYIPHNQVQGIKFHSEYNSDGGIYGDVVEFRSPGGKYSFRLKMTDERSVRKVLEPVYGKIK